MAEVSLSQGDRPTTRLISMLPNQIANRKCSDDHCGELVCFQSSLLRYCAHRQPLCLPRGKVNLRN
jgi:hypothetical protein